MTSRSGRAVTERAASHSQWVLGGDITDSLTLYAHRTNHHKYLLRLWRAIHCTDTATVRPNPSCSIPCNKEFAVDVHVCSGQNRIRRRRRRNGIVPVHHSFKAKSASRRGGFWENGLVCFCHDHELFIDFNRTFSDLNQAAADTGRAIICNYRSDKPQRLLEYCRFRIMGNANDNDEAEQHTHARTREQVRIISAGHRRIVGCAVLWGDD